MIGIEKNNANVNDLIFEGQSLIELFVYQSYNNNSDVNNGKPNKEMKEMFQSRINLAASLLVHNSPLT